MGLGLPRMIRLPISMSMPVPERAKPGLRGKQSTAATGATIGDVVGIHSRYKLALASARPSFSVATEAGSRGK